MADERELLLIVYRTSVRNLRQRRITQHRVNAMNHMLISKHSRDHYDSEYVAYVGVRP